MGWISGAADMIAGVRIVEGRRRKEDSGEEKKERKKKKKNGIHTKCIITCLDETVSLGSLVLIYKRAPQLLCRRSMLLSAMTTQCVLAMCWHCAVRYQVLGFIYG